MKLLGPVVVVVMGGVLYYSTDLKDLQHRADGSGLNSWPGPDFSAH